MKISKRLRVIGDLVPNNSFVLDIGCDHALLDIYIVNKNQNIQVIASDINKGPLKIAKQNITNYGLENKIKLKQGNGLEAYEKGVNTLVLSGLGTLTILTILNQKKHLLKHINTIIISSNNDYYKLRKGLGTLNYKIEKEELVIDKNKYYPIIVFTKGHKKYKYYELKYGPLLLKEKSKSFLEYLEFNKAKLIKINKSLSKKYFLKKRKIKKELKYLQELSK